MYEQLITQVTIRKLLRLVKPYVLQNSGSMQDVEDILQDGLLKVIEVYNRNGFAEESKPENYIFTICKNNWLKELERRKKLNLSGGLLVEEIKQDNWALREKQRKEALLEIIEKNLKLLSNKCQKVFNYRRDGLSCSEIAELLKLKNSQIVKDKHYRCKERLRELVKQDKAYWDLINDE